MVSSAKSTYDQANGGVTQIGAEGHLAQPSPGTVRAGDETDPRANAPKGLPANVEHLWPTWPESPNVAGIEQSSGMDNVHEMIVELVPADEPHRVLRSHAIDSCMELAQSRWLIIEQAQTSLPPRVPGNAGFLADLAVHQPRVAGTAERDDAGNSLCGAVSMAGAIYLILELNWPLKGPCRFRRRRYGRH